MEQPITQNEAVTIHNGATVNGVQVDTQVLMRRKGFDTWLSAKEGLQRWKAGIQAQELFDVKDLPIKQVRMSRGNGGFYKEGKNVDNAMPATRTAIGHLFSYIKDKPDNVVNNLLDLPLALRAQVFEHYIQRPEARNVVLRTAMANDKRIIRAVVSDVHSQDKGDDLQVINSLESIIDLAPDAKLRVIRQWDLTTAELILPNTAIKVLSKGITLYGKITLTNSETKGGSFSALAGSMNLVCLNGMTAMNDESTYRVRHMGDIGYKVRQSIRGGLEGVIEHLTVFKESYETPLTKTRAETLSAFIDHHSLPESTGTAMAALWDVDGERSGGDTLAGLVNAATRHAQSLQVADASKLEALAGETLHKGLSSFL